MLNKGNKYICCEDKISKTASKTASFLQRKR
jgi:hypothetical protein